MKNRSTLTMAFVADGWGRAWSAAEGIVRSEVAAEFAERLQAAGFWLRLSLRWQMHREIVRRLQRRAPFDAVY
jgi:hypothetical protein